MRTVLGSFNRKSLDITQFHNQKKGKYNETHWLNDSGYMCMYLRFQIQFKKNLFNGFGSMQMVPGSFKLLSMTHFQNEKIQNAAKFNMDYKMLLNYIYTGRDTYLYLFIIKILTSKTSNNLCS